MSTPHLVEIKRQADIVRADRLLRLQPSLAIVGVGRSKWLEMVRTGEAPAAVKIGGRCVAWSERALYAWVQARIAESTQ